jgi:GTP-binding protein EngB required for normal cell division
VTERAVPDATMPDARVVARLAPPREIGPLDERLRLLRDAVEGARAIGLEEHAAEARAVARRVARRAGFGGVVYVMALAGGTGVGKSSVLNALAGREVSPAAAIRPTTDRPVAWVAATKRDEVWPLLDWLKVAEIVTHEEAVLDDVAILDLPDVDSVRGEHRALVDMLLPRIDALTWVVDPEKYDDARIHGYFRDLARHADRLRFILNKADRLTDDERQTVVEDLRRRLVADGIPRPIIHVVSALEGEGVERFATEVGEAAHAKVVISAKLEADRAEAAGRLGRAAGLEGDAGYAPLLDPRRREALVDEAVAGALALVDPTGLARQVRSAVLQQARIGGGSFIGRLIGLFNVATGRSRRVADPAAYLAGWRTRGAIGRVLNPVRAAMTEASEAAPSGSRRALLGAMGAPSAGRQLEQVIDRATRIPPADLEVPRSPIWPVIGAFQILAGALLVLGVAWLVTLFVIGGTVPVATVEVPLLGPIPMPLALLVAGAAVSALLGWILGLHASWIGRGVARRVTERVAVAVREAVERDGFAGIDRVEDARRTIARAMEVGPG